MDENKKQNAEKDNRKIKFSGEIICPVCRATLEVEAGKIILVPPEQGKYEEFVEVRKSPQTKLLDQSMTQNDVKIKKVKPADKKIKTKTKK